jgi:hypothetical protein
VCDKPKDACANRHALGVDEHAGVFVKLDGAAVPSLDLFLGLHNNSFHYLTLQSMCIQRINLWKRRALSLQKPKGKIKHLAIACLRNFSFGSLLDRTSDNIANGSVSALGFNALDFLCAAIIADDKPASWDEHPAISTKPH